MITRAQAVGVGLTPRAIETRLSSRGWSALRPGVYLLPGAPRDRRTELAAVQFSLGHEALFSHTTAAELHLLEGIEPHREIHGISPNGNRLKGIEAHRLGPSDRPRSRLIERLRTTLIERTLLDCAALVHPRSLGLAMDDALRTRRTTLARLTEELQVVGGRGRKGSQVFGDLLRGRDDRDGRLRSVLEARLLAILRRIRECRVEVDFEVRIGEERFVLDFAYPPWMLGIEAQSIRWHLATERLKREWARLRQLQGAGWTILPYGWDDVTFAPDEVEAEVRRFLALQARSLRIEPP